MLISIGNKRRSAAHGSERREVVVGLCLVETGSLKSDLFFTTHSNANSLVAIYPSQNALAMSMRKDSQSI